MISDSERREIAARLRFTDHNLTWIEGCFCIAEDVGAAPTGNEHDDVLDFAHALADLIDPPTGWPVSDHDSYCPECGGAFRKEDATERTCKQVLTECNDGLMPPFTAHCSECGTQWGYTPNYCPNCGAKVVE